jgi:uncharacterized protein (DUF1697 family)
MRLIAFLRAINVGGHTVKMDALRGHFAGLGFTDVETFIASGNVLFTSRAASTPALQRKIEDRLHASLGYEVKTFIRTDAEVAAIACYQPFKESELRSAGALNVGFLAEPLGAAAAKALMAMQTDIDDFHANGREVYWLCRKRQNESTINNVRFEKLLSTRVTFRGVNTVARLAAKYGFLAQTPGKQSR